MAVGLSPAPRASNRPRSTTDSRPRRCPPLAQVRRRMAPVDPVTGSCESGTAVKGPVGIPRRANRTLFFAPCGALAAVAVPASPVV